MVEKSKSVLGCLRLITAIAYVVPENQILKFWYSPCSRPALSKFEHTMAGVTRSPIDIAVWLMVHKILMRKKLKSNSMRAVCKKEGQEYLINFSHIRFKSKD